MEMSRSKRMARSRKMVPIPKRKLIRGLASTLARKAEEVEQDLSADFTDRLSGDVYSLFSAKLYIFLSTRFFPYTGKYVNLRDFDGIENRSNFGSGFAGLGYTILVVSMPAAHTKQ